MIWRLDMNENVIKFFKIYNADAALRERIDEAEACYPGSLEIRDSLVSAILLPEAEKLGLSFTVDELRKYEEEKWASAHKDVEQTEADLAKSDEDERYWLINRGWSSDEARFCGDK